MFSVLWNGLFIETLSYYISFFRDLSVMFCLLLTFEFRLICEIAERSKNKIYLGQLWVRISDYLHVLLHNYFDKNTRNEINKKQIDN